MSGIVLTLEDGTEGADYLASLRRAGFSDDEIVVLRSHDAPLDAFDGLVLGGGEDVDPSLFGAPRGPKTEPVNRRRDDQELSLIDAARASGAPILGICRGLQVLNVALGGTLVQDIPSEKPAAREHRVRSPRDFLAHEVEVDADCPLGPRGTRLGVNSRHHQAVDRVAGGLRVVARAADGIVEAVDGEPQIFAVQWHPENLGPGRQGQELFAAFRKRVLSPRTAGTFPSR